MDCQSLRTDDCMDQIIDEYSDMVYRIALNHVGSKFDADDIYQEVFLKCYQNHKRFNDEEHRKAWLIRVTVNCCRKFHTNIWRKRTVPLEENTLTFEMPEENEVYSALMQIPIKYRTVLHLFYFENMSVEEISTTLDIRPATIRMQLTRGRAMMKEKLKGDYFNE